MGHGHLGNLDRINKIDMIYRIFRIEVTNAHQPSQTAGIILIILKIL